MMKNDVYIIHHRPFRHRKNVLSSTHNGTSSRQNVARSGSNLTQSCQSRSKSRITLFDSMEWNIAVLGSYLLLQRLVSTDSGPSSQYLNYSVLMQHIT